MKKQLTASLAVVLAFSMGAQNNVFTTQTRNGRQVSVEVLNDNVVKVINTLPGEQIANTGISVLRPQPFAGRVIETDAGQVITTSSGVTVSISAADGAVTVSSGADRAVSDNGVRILADGQRTMKLSTMGSGSFYGAGERGYSFNLAGDTMVVYNKQNYGYTYREDRIRQMNITMPLFISSNGYAVLFDDFAAAKMIMSNPIVYTTESPAPIAWYYINGAGSLEGVTRQLTALTGRQDLPPFWSLGYITSKYGYKTQAETLGVVDSLKTRGYPLDGIVLDLYWYGKEEDMGRLAWDPEQWPDHRAMLNSLNSRGVNLIPISQPYVLRNGRGLDNFNALDGQGIFVLDSLGNTQEVTIWVGEGGMFDVSAPAARQWLRNRYRTLTDEGIGGWWGDLGEPEVHPETGVHANGLTARQYHNMYGNDWSRIIYDLYRDEYPNTRLMTLMRGGTTGLQRYSVFPWSTDVSRSWGGLRPQVIIMLNAGLSGLGYMSHDVGGFAIDPENPTDPELYVRWLQLGAFSPVLRTHAQFAAEPYNYPEYEDIIKALIRDRYRWLPYNYTMAYENASQGLPLVRPLNFYTPASTRYDDIEDEYLWGRDVLVAPVLTQGTTSRPIVFPDGLWVDFSNPEKIYHGGDTIQYDAPIAKLPLFVRAGSFIPMADYRMENTRDYRVDRYTVNYYPVEGLASSFTLFEDDRTSTNTLEEGQYALVTFKGNDTASAITVDLSSEGGWEGRPASKEITLVLHNVAKPASVMFGNTKVKNRDIKYDATTKTLTVKVVWNTNNPATLTINK